jgi:tripartite-type tricarboxylate transporter receptor subunit TctC
VALAKKQPGTLTYGSTGTGGSQHLAGEIFKRRVGIDIVHVPYKGAAPALQDLMAGHISMVFMTSVSAVEVIKAGKIRALAVASASRIPQLPELPTMSEAGIAGFESDSWNGLFVPKGTPLEVVARLQSEVAKAVATPDLRDRLLAQGGVLVGNTPAEFRSFIKQEVEHWAQVFQTVNVKAD